ncbi:hypothetical protein ACFV2U_17020 [Streptomyces sp. NPDC059697]|uniref:hypothetical protein n=1 Tax=Streptomyces sp. NPDC059697 TaxID=3346912 RepID=UPI00368A0229
MILILALAVLLALLGTAAAEQIVAFRNAAATADNARLEITLQGLVHICSPNWSRTRCPSRRPTPTSRSRGGARAPGIGRG